MALHQLLFLILLAAACAYACARGGPPERLVAIAFVIAPLLTALLQVGPYRSIQLGIMTVDVGLLGLMLAIALASTRFWPLLMTSLQGSEVLGHVARLLAPDTVPEAYYAVVAFWSFPMVALLAWGTWRHRLRLRRYGIDYNWTYQLPLSYRKGCAAGG